jgi:hypothetical protein
MRRTIALVLIGLGVVLVAGSAFALSANSKTTTAKVSQEIRRVVVENQNGDVTFRPGRETKVTRTEHWNFVRTQYTQTISDGVLTVKAKCPSMLLFNNCSVQLALVVPKTVDVRTTTTNGDIEVRELEGDSLALATTNGDVDITDIHSDSVSATSTNGDLALEELRTKTLRAATTNGDIGVRVARRPDDLRLASTNGDIEAVVPSGSYDITTHTTHGDIDIEGLEDDSSSGNALSAETTNGDIDIRAD